MDNSRDTASEMYRRMFRSRSFELAAIEKLRTGKIPGDRLQDPATLL